MKHKFLTYGLPLIGLLMLLFALVRVFSHKEQKAEPPLLPPYESPYAQKVAGLGLVEPASRSLSIAPQVPGVVAKLFVKEGQWVKKDDVLFIIDDRDAQVKLDTAKASLKTAEVNFAQAKDQYERINRVSDTRAVSQEEMRDRFFAFEKNKALRDQSQSDVARFENDLELLKVKSPIDGEVLKVNVRPGEYAPIGITQTPLMIVGNTKKMHVRVEIDETDVLRFSGKGKAVGTLRGYPQYEIPLKFLHKDPFVTPKKSLTSDGNERVDTRVMEVIYEFDPKDVPAYTGQLMDVYIEASPIGDVAEKHEVTPTTATHPTQEKK